MDISKQAVEWVTEFMRDAEDKGLLLLELGLPSMGNLEMGLLESTVAHKSEEDVHDGSEIASDDDLSSGILTCDEESLDLVGINGIEKDELCNEGYEGDCSATGDMHKENRQAK